MMRKMPPLCSLKFNQSKDYKMKLLSINGNTKIAKTNKAAEGRYLYAGLSMMPNDKTCPGAKAAGCMATCLQSAGRGIFKNVQST